MTDTPLDKFHIWLSTQKDKPDFIYYSGHLSVECEAFDSAQAREVREAAWKAYEAGRVALVQRRRRVGGFDYIAQRRKK